ncbi:MAG TPA: hypothetical protein PLI27_09640 [Ignavibacteriales bacterium]|nr:hypothetical protein [Ignavibacteriales bacterium]HOL81986.1 hypothetical protein [Ignavibacteriales bacterium]HOM64970.1 hypothetical protein [Ignavibacteriales bacterium]HPD68322.1 hypothetical protein [Ignavibacteriales bacterium]HPP34123.1 hypothetical protein [Ignavibacteriales bacterium]
MPIPFLVWLGAATLAAGKGINDAAQGKETLDEAKWIAEEVQDRFEMKKENLIRLERKR